LLFTFPEGINKGAPQNEMSLDVIPDTSSNTKLPKSKHQSILHQTIA
jgi:hypothetical protein